ncbi:acyltransferase [Alicyclobacillus sendaiensis]|uniref:Acyltransferase n=1 Tax=Alicyclobacillus sendaiensis PA2 TaxID=3029425 RepID=A0ABT6XYG2_ALISE|nr:acyltransferase [Alicyclobacillus sendaiensis]MDI9260062.1 acyltransferase [Alicyclobacillus sendaiensis PA2]
MSQALAKKPHLYEVDLMRACIILGVICVHVLSSFNVRTADGSWMDVSSGILMMTFHFTREAFMFITGLVLFYTYYDRPFSAASFWKKRFLLIAIPYIAWTAIYILFQGTFLKGFEWTAPYLLHTFLTSLATAKQYFLYFLLVSMQLYVVFPLMVRWLKRSARWHRAIVVVAFLVEMGIMIWNQASLQFVNVYQLPAWLRILVRYRDRDIFTYEFWFIAGAMFAIYYPRLKSWAISHARALFGIWLGMWFLLFGVYFLNRDAFHLTGGQIVDTLQPVMVPYSLAVALLLWRIGLGWQARRAKGHLPRASRVIRFFGGVSFGIFLIHPIALRFVELLADQIHAPLGVQYAMLPIWIALTYVSSGVAAYLIGKIPFVGYIVGEKAGLPKSMTRKTASSAAG